MSVDRHVGLVSPDASVFAGSELGRLCYAAAMADYYATRRALGCEGGAVGDSEVGIVDAVSSARGLYERVAEYACGVFERAGESRDCDVRVFEGDVTGVERSAGGSHGSGSVGSSEGAVVCGRGLRGDSGVYGDVGEARGKHWRRNRVRKEKARASRVSGSAVPEWRRKPEHVGVFSSCTEEVQRELRESRAKMLVEKNKAEAVEAVQRRVVAEARAKARLVEEEVEKRRLEVVASNKKLREAQMSKYPPGFAETVVSLGLESVIGTPSLSSGSVSPNSSISVAELKRKDAALEMLVAKVAELTAAAANHDVKKKEEVREMHVSDGYERDLSPGVVEVRTGRQAKGGVGKKRMSSTERAKRNYLCLPVEGPGSGMDGHCRWD